MQEFVQAVDGSQVQFTRFPVGVGATEKGLNRDVLLRTGELTRFRPTLDAISILLVASSVRYLNRTPANRVYLLALIALLLRCY
jgi:hypothetical protein